MATKFKNFIKEVVKSGREICIGASEGTNFMYIGPWDKKGEAWTKEKFQKNFEDMERLFPNLYKKMETMAKYSYEFKDIYEGDKLKKSAETQLIEHCQNVASTVKRYRRVKTFLKTYHPLDERYVTDSYIRDTDNRMVIKISGMETGKYWFRDEVIYDQIMELLKSGVDPDEISEKLGYSTDYICDMINHYEEDKKKQKANY